MNYYLIRMIYGNKTAILIVTDFDRFRYKIEKVLKDDIKYLTLYRAIVIHKLQYQFEHIYEDTDIMNVMERGMLEIL